MANSHGVRVKKKNTLACTVIITQHPVVDYLALTAVARVFCSLHKIQTCSRFMTCSRITLMRYLILPQYQLRNQSCPWESPWKGQSSSAWTTSVAIWGFSLVSFVRNHRPDLCDRLDICLLGPENQEVKSIKIDV